MLYSESKAYETLPYGHTRTTVHVHLVYSCEFTKATCCQNSPLHDGSVVSVHMMVI